MKTPLKILFLSNRGLLPIKDGHTRRSFNILKGLAENNQVYYLSLYESPEEIEPQNIFQLNSLCVKVEFIPAPPKKINIAMIKRLLGSLFSSKPYTIWRHYSKEYHSRVNEIIKQEQFDIIHCDILPLAYTIPKKSSITWTITDHDVSYLKCLRMAKSSNNLLLKIFLYLEAWKLKRLECSVIEKVELTIVVSEKDKNILKKQCPNGKFLVVENGVDLNIFRQDNVVNEDKTLIWVGGLDDYSNREGMNYFFKEIYPMIKEKIPEIVINIIGEGNKKINQFAQFDDSINLLGFVINPIQYIQKSTVFVAPILSGGGTRLKILEAMSAGKAIVSTSIGCEGIEGRNNDHYLIADTPEEFTNNVCKLIFNKELRDKLGNNAISLVKEKYDWKLINKKLNEAYLKLIKRF